MRILWAGLYPAGVDLPNDDLTAPAGAITQIDVSGIARHDTAVAVMWRGEKEPEDHPNLGCLEMLVHPDGTSEFLAAGAGSGWGDPGSFGTIQAIRFTSNGPHTVELRPWLMPPDPRALRSVESTPAGDRRLAILPLYVTGVPDRPK